MAFIQMEYKSEALLRGTSIKVILPTDGMSGKWEPPFQTVYFLPGYSTAKNGEVYVTSDGTLKIKGYSVES